MIVNVIAEEIPNAANFEGARRLEILEFQEDAAGGLSAMLVLEAKH